MIALRVDVRTLAEFRYETGDLSPSSVALERMRQGAAAHRSAQSAYGETFRREVALSGEWTEDGVTLRVHGRADGVGEAGGARIVEEFKTVFRVPDAYAGEAVHWAQVEIYAHLLCEKEDLPAVRVRLIYLTSDGARVSLTRDKTRAALAESFLDCARPYAAWVRRVETDRAQRMASARALPFPFDTYRAGQREMARNVYVAIRDGGALFCEAPTGIGKTAAALYAAVKAMGEGAVVRAFYLTARGTGQAGAIRALEQMRAKGLRARFVALGAKEKCCPMAEMRCDADYCPRARGYFDRRRAVLWEALERDDYARETVAQLAEKHTLCPFELSLDLTELCDVVICDYNYAFDPRVRLERHFAGSCDAFLLADEAHNLVSRARDMFSAALSERDARELRREIGKVSGRGGLYRRLTAFLRAFPGADSAPKRSLPERNQTFAVTTQSPSERDGTFAKVVLSDAANPLPSERDGVRAQASLSDAPKQSPSERDGTRAQASLSGAPNQSPSERDGTRAQASLSDTPNQSSFEQGGAFAQAASSVAANLSPSELDETFPQASLSDTPNPSPSEQGGTLARASLSDAPNQSLSEQDGAFAEAVAALSDALAGELDGSETWRAGLRDLYFELLAYRRASAAFDPRTDRMLIERTGKRTRVKLFCCDPAPRLAACLAKTRGAAFFSATLSPLDFYRDRLGGGDMMNALLRLDSPFPRENLLTLCAPVNTRFAARTKTLPRVASLIAAFLNALDGNALVCFPSYAYLRVAYEICAPLCPEIDLRAQTPDMDDAAREAFLTDFRADGERPVAAFVAMGGVFSEGVDLAGDRLVGCAVVGAGLPQLSFENDCLRDLYASVGAPGFDFAYVYPGAAKVTQAAGRVIRTETDRGVVLLLDDRWNARRDLLPAWWDIRYARSEVEIARRVRAHRAAR